ncbi:hypothetical protein DICPUDRAFT_36676, partial [Dictyostelium purpureum]
IRDVSFLYNNIDVTNKTVYNSMYFNYSSNVPRDTPFILYLNGDDIKTPRVIYSLAGNEIPFYAFWNSTIELFQIDFIIPANSQPSNNYPYNLIVNRVYTLPNYALPASCQLRVKSSNMDLYGPVFKKITKLTNIDADINVKKVGWKVEIEDEVNGFQFGNIVVRGSIDNSIYNFTFSPKNALAGSVYRGEYEIYVNVSSPCVSQNFIMTEVLLQDSMGFNSSFSITFKSQNGLYSILNPFINYLNDSLINSVSLNCPSQNFDSSPPELLSFVASRSSIDVGSLDRTVNIVLEARDIDSELKNDQTPIVYFSDTSLGLVSCHTQQISSNKTNSIYNCSVEIPVGFGYPHGIYISVYGLINRFGLYSGFAVDQLKNSGFSYFISTVDSFDTNQPIISGNKKLSTKDTKLWLYGKGFNDVKYIEVFYHLDNAELQTIFMDNLYPSAISLTLSKKTYKPFYVTLVTKNGRKSNQYLVSPFYFPIPNYIDITQETSNPSSTSSNSEDPIITNAPQECKGTPKCGGDKKGTCTSNGCMCYYPYVGLDCSSKSIETLPPSLNKTTPDIELPTTENGGNSETEVTYKSLVSIVALRELDYDHKQFKYHPLKDWKFKQINSSVSEYYCGIEISNKTVSIKTKIQWFDKETTIEFANQTLIMNPSTIKYTIEISSYPFSTNLNSLQLIMLAKIESSKTNNICSNKEFGETSNGIDNSNYIKVQVEDHSVYGRFIKRAFLDNKVKSISNEFLDESLSTLSSSYQSQSFVGINIPYFKEMSIIDPDFSVLLDGSSASSKSNSICSKNSGLSASKIAGIVIGCVAFIVVIIVSIIYHYRKKHKNLKFFQAMNNKLNQNNLL